MDKASILGDAIEYLKELLQQINELEVELEMNTSTSDSNSSYLLSSPTTTTSLYPLTTASSALPPIKKEHSLIPQPSPYTQPVKVEVRLGEGKMVSIHMYCERKQGLVLATMRALEYFGLDIQQAAISCFNGFKLDIYRAEQCREGEELDPDQIKAVLLDYVYLLT